MQHSSPGGGNQEGSQLHRPRGATGERVADREGHESQKFLGYGERVEVGGGSWRSR